MTGRATRGQSGMDRLALFVLVVLVVVAAAPFVLEFAGIDVRAPPDAGGGTDEDDGPPELVVLSAEATALNQSDNSVGVVRMVLTRAGGDQPVDLSAVTVSWSNGGAYTLAHTDTAGPGADGEFATSLVRADRVGNTLSQEGDRGVVRFDLGSDDIGGVAEFGSRLRPGETVTVRFETADGRVTTTNLTVPETLPNSGPVGL